MVKGKRSNKINKLLKEITKHERVKQNLMNSSKTLGRIIKKYERLQTFLVLSGLFALIGMLVICLNILRAI